MSRRQIIGGLIVVLSMWFGAIGSPDLQAGEWGPYESEGTVIEIIPEQGQIVLDHAPIRAPGYFMGAMEMPFSVENPSLLKTLKPGDHVHFRVSEDKKSRIVDLRKLP